MTKITEETKIKDLIPERFDLDKSRNPYSLRGKWLYIPIKLKEKSFEDYVKEFYQRFDPDTSEALYMMKIDPKDLSMQNKLGLLWYIAEDKGADWHDWVDLQALIEDENYDVASDTATSVYELFPSSFIESFKQE